MGKLMIKGVPASGTFDKAENVKFNKENTTGITSGNVQGAIEELNDTLSNKADITDLKGIVKSKNISITTNGYGQFVGTIGANNKYYIIGVKEPTGGIVNYSYNDGTYKIAGYVYNWAGAVVASKTFTLTVYYLDLN